MIHDPGRPEVLILQVDQAMRPRHDLGVGVRDAAFAVGGERVARADGSGRCAAAAPRRCPRGAGVGSRGGSGPAARSSRRTSSLMTSIGLRDSGVGSVHRSRNTSSTSATAGPRTASWMSCQGGRSPYTAAIGCRCGVTVVLRTVVAAVAQVDAADERDVQLRAARGGAGRRTSGGASRPGAPACPAGIPRPRLRCPRPGAGSPGR